MKLREIEFGNVFIASGARNFFGEKGAGGGIGEGWRHHGILEVLFPGFNFRGAAFVSKTTTLLPREGNMKLDARLQPVSLFPDCVRINLRRKVVLNALGLSGPGIESLLSTGYWQKRIDSFLLSVMSVGDNKEERVREAEMFTEILARELPNFSAKVGVEVNFSCPNTKHNPLVLVDEVIDQLRPFARLDIPKVAKLNALTPIDAAVRIADSGLCDAITVSNTIPWGQLPEEIDWKGLFGSLESPLKKYGGGGLSGYPLLSIVTRWISEVRRAGVTIPIIGGGGILKQADVDTYHQSGADAIMVGTVAMLRPWRLQGIIRHGNEIYGGGNRWN